MPSFPSSVPVASTLTRDDIVKVGLGMDKYLYANGLVKPEHRKLLAYQQPQYWNALTALLERMGRSEVRNSSTYSWSELGRTRQSAAVTVIGTNGSLTNTITTDVAATQQTGPNAGYFVVGDTLLTETRKQLRVESIAFTGNVQVLTVSKSDGTVFAAGDVAASERIGHVGSAFAEATFHPDGRIFFPTESYNNLQISKRTAKLSRNSLIQAYWVDDLMDAFYFDEDSVIQMELARDFENNATFGVKSPFGAAVPTTEGFVTTLLTNAGSVKTTVTGAATEADIQAHITKLLKSGPASEYLVVAGADYMGDITVALKSYYQNGAVIYGKFGAVDTVGLELQSYKFQGKTIHFVYAPIFNDTATLPFQGTSTSTKINFSRFSAWLNMGTDSKGQKLMTMTYAPQSELIYGVEAGMAGDGKTFGGKVASSFDGTSIYIMGERGVELRCLNQHGVMYSNG